LAVNAVRSIKEPLFLIIKNKQVKGKGKLEVLDKTKAINN
jgi:hypothetical protein